MPGGTAPLKTAGFHPVERVPEVFFNGEMARLPPGTAIAERVTEAGAGPLGTPATPTARKPPCSAPGAGRRPAATDALLDERERSDQE
jgi:hypothetical protein